MPRWFAVAIPVILAALAILLRELWIKMLAPSVIALLVVLLYRGGPDRPPFGRSWVFPLCVALVLSAAGDWFLSTYALHERPFLVGLGLYFAAHIAYTVMALRRGRIRWWVLAVGGVPMLVYVIGWLLPELSAPPLEAGIVLYAVVTAVSVAAIAGVRDSGRWLAVPALGLIVVSDIMIAQDVIREVASFHFGITATYMAAHGLLGVDALRPGGMRP